MKPRCPWPADDPLMVAYHDQEWGVPLHDDRRHFEFLILDAAQAGLSWRTILYKREGYRKAFADYDVEAVARFTKDDEARLLQDPGIVRNRLKVASGPTNARAFLKVQAEFGSFDTYIWRFVDGVPIDRRMSGPADHQATSRESDAMSKDLLKRGFKFVGSTICYAYMQAAGLINDHYLSCFRHDECAALATAGAH